MEPYVVPVDVLVQLKQLLAAPGSQVPTEPGVSFRIPVNVYVLTGLVPSTMIALLAGNALNIACESVVNTSLLSAGFKELFLMLK